MKNSLVVKSNDLIQARYNLSLNEQKIILYAVSKLDREKEKFNIISLNIREFAELLSTTQERYTEIKDIVRELRAKEVIIKTERAEIIAGWLSSIEYIRDTGTIELEFSEKLIPYLLQLKEKFTRYQLKNILNLSGKYSIRLYELLKQYEKISTREFKLEEIKRILFCEDMYKDFRNFDRVVLKVAKEEINEHTDINISYEKIKTGRRITSILFKIESKDLHRKEYIDFLNESYSIKEMQEKMGLKDENLSTEQIINIYSIAVEKLSDSELIDIFEYVRLNYIYAKNKKSTRNIYSYLMKCLENDYAVASAQIKLDYYIES